MRYAISSGAKMSSYPVSARNKGEETFFAPAFRYGASAVEEPPGTPRHPEPFRWELASRHDDFGVVGLSVRRRTASQSLPIPILPAAFRRPAMPGPEQGVGDGPAASHQKVYAPGPRPAQNRTARSRGRSPPPGHPCCIEQELSQGIPMTETKTTDNQAILYSKVEPLTPTLHGALGLVRIDQPLLFARDAHAVPLNTIEFNFALKNYPIVFAGTDSPMPVAVLGMQEKENLFVDADGKWLEAAYVPAYIRRYPFIFGQSQDGQQLTLCIDRDSKLIGENADFPFFNGTELTDTSNKAMEFCKTFHQHHIATQKFGVIVKEMDLFTSQQVTMKGPDGKTHVVGSYLAIDEKKFNELKDEAILILRKAGALPFIYMHLSSLSNWQSLSFRRQQMLGAPFPPNAPELPEGQAANANVATSGTA